MTLVGGAYALSGPLPFIDRVTAQSSEELLRAYAAKDTDGDLLPDWQEALYGTDPEDPRSFKDEMTDAEAVSAGLLTPKAPSSSEDSGDIDVEGVLSAEGTLTDELAREFFSTYLTTRGTNPPTAEEIDSFAEEFVRKFQADSNEFSSFSAAQIRVIGSGPDAIRVYAIQMEQIFSKHDPSLPKNELQYLDDAVTHSNNSALPHLATIGAAYTEIGEELVTVAVPAEAKVAHLAIANAMKHMGASVTNMSKIDTDPVRVMVGMESYTASAEAYRAGFTAMNVVFGAAEVAFTQGEKGFDFYNTTVRARNTQ